MGEARGEIEGVASYAGGGTKVAVTREVSVPLPASMAAWRSSAYRS